ncbi:MAG TPA: glycerophosphodiester phosphodiesterase [Phenylobacterium sp.]|jgi:glycerophosphoryl diester phosphodiesterase|uniref:glycerophosphodiester phosphodiesterase n=1 Tax=Phenylobacterium sp. TaxID=1871053 RepID=UPI002CDAA564|nr:glycerophosphodiester phosphodiesterase [Phenylobacterium sp.]HXA40689.1 glycerophosphodiester phosphodiesterase [Phenylobacterium sp.]
MDITRRTLAAAAAAAAVAGLPARAAAPDFKQGFRKTPLIIGHRGASGERPESTLAAFRLAIAEGADFIEPDLVVTKDGHLVVRHENEISQTTDVALRPEFENRLTTRQIQGQGVSGWFTEDFTLEELKTLRCRERLPKLRPESARFNGQEAIPTYQEVIDLAKAESARLKRVIGTYPEMKHASYFAGIGLPMEGRLADILKANGLDGANAPVFIQCFDVLPLKTIMTLCQAPRIQLVSPEGGPTDVTLRYKDMVSASGMKAIATYANGVGPDWSMVIPTVDGGIGAATSLVADAHAAGLAVHPWTVRAENFFLPPKQRIGTDPAAHGDVDAVYRALYAAGVDGLFSDFPGLAVKARG